jgi:predicted MPP superfamily phosphohydrolase
MRRPGRRAAAALVLVAEAGLAWAWFEAGWVRLRTLDCPVPGLPDELAGLRIAHLSDFHLGVPSRGEAASERASEWVADRSPDLTCLTGDLLARPRGEPQLSRIVARLPSCFAVLGNHDFADTFDPFAREADVTHLDSATLLRDEERTLELCGRSVQLVGVDPRSYRRGTARPERLVDPAADLRILLCHFPPVVYAVPPDAFHLVLAGHMHDGQLVIPYPGGKLRLAHPHARLTSGLYRFERTTLHVSPGLGTTFVPFRFFARPEATELVLRPASPRGA